MADRSGFIDDINKLAEKYEMSVHCKRNEEIIRQELKEKGGHFSIIFHWYDKHKG